MDRALEQQAFKVDHKVSESLRSMAEDMGFLKAGPRNVVDVHSTDLNRRRAGAVSKKVRAYSEEGRVMVLELMGY
jgi:ABC-type taurine transport system ATPase subunit